MLEENLTSLIIRAYFNVYNKLGYGFLEKVYESALLIELRKIGLKCYSQIPIEVYYEEQQVGIYQADIIVENKIIIEIKAASTLLEEHENQLLNYLKATTIEVGLLLNFGKEAQYRRKVFSKGYTQKTYVSQQNPRKSA